MYVCMYVCFSQENSVYPLYVYRNIIITCEVYACMMKPQNRYSVMTKALLKQNSPYTSNA